jgi:rubrerythrin
MTTKATAKSPKSKAPKKLEVDAEARALMANPVFRAMLQEAKNTKSADDIPLEELERRLGPMTEAERAHAEAYLAALDLLEEEQGGEVTDGQGRLLRLLLIGAEYARGQGTLAQLAEDSGCAAADIRAVAAALRAAGLVETAAAR